MSVNVVNMIRPLGVSKHRQFDDKGQWIPGRVRLNSNSSLRKLMRAARRGKLPEGRAVLIKQTTAIAARHPMLHMTPSAKARHLQKVAAL